MRSGEKRAFACQAVVHIDDLPPLVGADGDAPAHVGDDEIVLLIGDAQLAGGPSGRGPLRKGVKHAASARWPGGPNNAPSGDSSSTTGGSTTKAGAPAARPRSAAIGAPRLQGCSPQRPLRQIADHRGR